MHPPKSNKKTISGTGIQENISQGIWRLAPKGTVKEPDKARLLLKVDRIKGPGEGSEIHLNRSVVEIAGKDQWGHPKTSAVLELDSNTSTNPSPGISTKPLLKPMC